MKHKRHPIVEKFKIILTNKHYSDSSIKMYCHYLNEYILKIGKNPYKLNKSDLEKYLLSYTYSSISKQNQVISSLKLFYKYILKTKILKINGVERPRKEKRLPQIIDKDHILSSCREINNLKHKSIILLAYSIGLRVSEVINLKITDIDSERMIITINQSKGRKDRIAPLTENILKLLRNYFKQYKPKEYLFNGQVQIQYTASSCNKIVKRYLGEKYHFHLLRHSCFTNLTDQGVDLRVIQKLAGHSSSKTTEIYTHVSTQLLNKLPLAI